MPKSSDQKLKILYLLKFLNENTDEDHPATMQDILAYLEKCGIESERKSIYSDIDALNRMDYDIMYTRNNPSGYYLAGRQFELAELKLLVDAVQSSKFITEKKSDELIKKIESLTSRSLGQKLQRQVYVANRVKASNESILYNIDEINEAINSGYRIEFKYCEWNTDKVLIPKHNGMVYSVDPIALLWDDENYYLVAYDQTAGINKHYRVDKMKEISVSTKRNQTKARSNFDPAVYSKEHFGMFAGEENTVSIEFTNRLIGVMIDRFGADSMVIKKDTDKSIIRARIKVSDQFFAWISGFRGTAVITSPKEVCEEYGRFIADISNAL